MRIQSVEIHQVSMRLNAPFETSFGVEHDRHCLILRVSAEGLQGWGECVAGEHPGFSYETVGTALHVLKRFFVPAILGSEIADASALHQRLMPFRGHPLARAGLEMALWDLWGKAQGRSLAQMLGGLRARVPVGVSIGLQSSLGKLLELVQGYRESGYARVKLKIKPGQDLELVRAVRADHPDLALQVDANAAYSPDQMALFKDLDSLELLLIEQPFEQDDLLAHARLQAELQTPVCLDESVGSLRLARQALDLAACRVINIKPGRVGGLSEAVAIHDLCLGRGIPVWCGGMLETGVGRASNLALATLPGFSLPGDISASERYYAEDIASPRFRLNPDSSIDVPTGPGLGIEVDQQALERASLHREILEMN